mmetsp:Transcript_99682/g.281404  ORF Transcript_99682/g.281404 Transcript_99682/m.281404 type:complete len:231 (+) Transcript_99682:168-860(+)
MRKTRGRAILCPTASSSRGDRRRRNQLQRARGGVVPRETLRHQPLENAHELLPCGSLRRFLRRLHRRLLCNQRTVRLPCLLGCDVAAGAAGRLHICSPKRGALHLFRLRRLFRVPRCLRRPLLLLGGFRRGLLCKPRRLLLRAQMHCSPKVVLLDVLENNTDGNPVPASRRGGAGLLDGQLHSCRQRRSRALRAARALPAFPEATEKIAAVHLDCHLRFVLHHRRLVGAS